LPPYSPQAFCSTPISVIAIDHYFLFMVDWPLTACLISQTAGYKGRSHWPHGLRCGSAAARLLGLRVRILSGVMDVFLLWVLLLVRYRSLRRTDHSSRGVVSSAVFLNECDPETSTMRRPWFNSTVEPQKNGFKYVGWGAECKHESEGEIYYW